MRVFFHLMISKPLVDRQRLLLRTGTVSVVGLCFPGSQGYNCSVTGIVVVIVNAAFDNCLYDNSTIASERNYTVRLETVANDAEASQFYLNLTKDDF